MNEKINLREIEKRAFRDSQQDGLVEIIMGVFFFAIAGYLGTGGFPILLILLPIFAPIWLKIIRSRFTYPRIGYVKLLTKNSKAKEIMLGIFIYMFVVLFMTIIFPFMSNVLDLSLWYKWSLPFFVIMTVGVFTYVGYESGSSRYYILTVLSVAGGVIVSIIGFGTRPDLEMYFLGMNGVLIITGIILFVSFLRKYPQSAEVKMRGKK